MTRALIASLMTVLAGSASAQPSAGERAFQRCYACHSVVAEEDQLPGPNLRGVTGRRAGTLEGFAFSPAMKNAGLRGLVWTREALDAFMADPEAFLPGTTMAMPPVKDERVRTTIIEYLDVKR